MASLVGWVAFGEVLPGCSGAKYPEDAVEDVARISPGPAPPIFSSRWCWDQWLQYLPLFVGEVHAALLLLSKGRMTEPLYPHFRIYEIASTLLVWSPREIARQRSRWGRRSSSPSLAARCTSEASAISMTRNPIPVVLRKPGVAEDRRSERCTRRSR